MLSSDGRLYRWMVASAIQKFGNMSRFEHVAHASPTESLDSAGAGTHFAECEAAFRSSSHATNGLRGLQAILLRFVLHGRAS